MSEAGHVGQTREPKRLEVRSWWGRILVGRRPVRTMVRVVVVVVVAVLVTKWCFVPVRITGRSMEPTYHDGRLNVINMLAYHRRDPRRGDVVAIQLQRHRMVLLKRIMGVPGERIRVADGRVIINGRPLTEPYARGHDIPPSTHEALLGPEEYFVIGDNRDVSEYGIVRRSEIKGRALF